MQIKNISKKRAESLQQVELDFPNTEANLYYFSLKSNWEINDKILNVFLLLMEKTLLINYIQ